MTRLYPSAAMPRPPTSDAPVDFRRQCLRVVKVGGSLLDWPPLPRALREWLDGQPPAVNLLVCGGGPLTVAIRAADRTFALGEERAHWLCIDVLSVTAHLLAALLGDVPIVETFDNLPPTSVFDPRRFLYEQEPQFPGCVLPHTWSATTDSIAARIAETLAADELVLLKSADAPPHATLTDMAAAGYVDGHFPSAAAMLRKVQCLTMGRS